MATKNPLIQVRLNQKRYAVQQLHNTKQRLNTDLYNVILLKNFAFAYAKKYESSHDEAASQAAGEATLPEDNPDTSRNEEVTYEDLQEIAHKIYKDRDTSLSEIIEEAKSIDFNSSSNLSIRNLAQPTNGDDPNSLALKILQIIGQQSSLDSQITDGENEISDMTTEAKKSS